jgi:hypothetical protein
MPNDWHALRRTGGDAVVGGKCAAQQLVKLCAGVRPDAHDSTAISRLMIGSSAGHYGTGFASPGRLQSLAEQCQLPSQVSAIRVFDVLAWMEGTHGLHCPWPRRS